MARKILLADDSVTAQNMGRKILADAGYEVITVNNGSAALKKIGEHKPDLIVLDVYMPGYSGLEVCQRLKESGETSRIPVLLTVGKLEPFKPEEAKRVRADGYIVKPFEASELLSALSKLEDKVVPRAESSKTGRFARANAALEEGRYDKSMATEEDAGWKNRISFPSKKKKDKPAEQEVDTAEIYNPVNKDLRTVVEHKGAEAAPTAAAASRNEAHVNVGALAPEGLPKDVTPEEIAALAAAAAQIQGKVADANPANPAPEMTVTAPAEDAAKHQNTEVKAESKEEVRATEPAAVAEVAAPAPATFAEQESKEKIEEKSAEPAIVSTQADAMKAIMGLETQVMAAFSPESENGLGTYAKSERAEEPMTMAVAASAGGSAAAASRWTAVAVAVAPDEAALSLEQEMQKAYAEFAAAESGHAVAVAHVSETATAVAEPPAAPLVSESPVVATAVSEPGFPIPAAAPEVAQSLAAVPEAATEAVSATVKELEVAVSKYEAEQTPASTESVSDKSFKAAALESPSAISPELPALAESKTEDKIESKPEEKTEAKVEEKVEEKIETKIEEPEHSTLPSPQDIASAVTTVFAIPQFRSELPVPEPQLAAPVEQAQREPESAAVIETPETAVKTEVAEEKSSTEEASAEPVPVPRASRARGADDMAKRESDTAAAWASWRKIRETGSKPSGEAGPEEIPQDRAAMAVAAGAESKPGDVPALDSDPEISSLVDSVLADMRPKIVEEIARKLGKKK